MKRSNLPWLLLFPYALAYGAVMFSLAGGHPYEPSPYHRYQAESLLQRHLYLANSIDALQPGLVWHDGHVQHVWGLGVGVWLLPFEAAWRLFGAQPCPDGIVLSLTFALLAFFSSGTGLKLAAQGRRSFGLGVVWVVALCPALWTLARASQLVLEETVLYSIILSLGILVSLIRVAAFGSRADYFLCCVLGSYSAWVRPTHAVYGLGAILLASGIVWLRRRSAKEVAPGIAMLVTSMALLAWTNYIRFGSPVEFGHRLTVSSGTMMYLTRFGNPYSGAAPLQALKELSSLLFLTDPRGANAFSDGLFPGQSPLTRWRRLDLTTFDWSHAAMALLAVSAAALWLVRRWKKGEPWQRPQDFLVLSLLLWACFSTAALCCFYLYYPAMASRYLLDFAPAFAGFLLLGWALLPSSWVKFALPLLASWLVYEIASAKTPVEQGHSEQAVQLTLPRTDGKNFKDSIGAYTSDHLPSVTGIAGNGYGLEAEDGFASDVVSLAVDSPEFVELHVSERRPFNGEAARKDVYRAQIDGVPLPLRSVVNDPDGLVVTFDVPEKLRTRGRTEMLFICFSDGYDAVDRSSERFLFSVRWR